METITKISVADVRASLNPDIPATFWVRWIGRPLANLLTPFFHNRGWTANQVTAGRAVLAGIGVAVLAIPEPWLWPFSPILFYSCFLLDLVDGNLARMQRGVTYFGKLLDGSADSIYYVTAPLMAGIGSWLFWDQPELVAVGATISFVSIAQMMVRARVSFCREWMVGETGPLTPSELAAAERARKVQSAMSVVVIDVHIAVVAVLFVPRWGPLLFLAIAIPTQFAANAVWVVASFFEASAILRRPRQSRKAAIERPDPAVSTGENE